MGAALSIKPTATITKVAETAVTQWAAVMQGTQDYHVKLPTGSDVDCLGLVYDFDSTGAADEHITLITEGPANFIAGEAVSVGDRLSPYGTAGRLHKAPPGYPHIAIASEAVGTAGYQGVCYVVPRGYNQLGYTYKSSAITEDTTLTDVVPTGYRITGIAFQEGAGNAVSGGLNIGSAAAGQQVVATETVGASAIGMCTLVTGGPFSASAAQSLYVHAESAWNSASVTLFITMEKVIW